jgi:hypothetical protein
MTSLIGRQQKAYITNNVIGRCLINLISAIKHVSKKKLSALILLIDFRKAFDSSDHGFIRTALKAYGFNDGLIRWIELFFDNRYAMKFIRMFHNISGLSCNLEKTIVIPIGQNTNVNDRICTE